MNFSPDDPKITAYALGELPAKEAKEIELALKNSPELRAAVEEIRLTAELLKNEFSVEPTPVLSKNEKDAVVATIQPHNVVSPNRNFWRTAGIGAIAASILAVITWQIAKPERKEAQMSMAPQETELRIVAAPVVPPAGGGVRPNSPAAKTLSASKPKDSPERFIVEAEPEFKLHQPKVAADASAKLDASTKFALKEIPKEDRNQNRTAILNDSTRQLATLGKTSGNNGVSSYEGKIVSPPPVQRLPLVGVSPTGQPEGRKNTGATKQQSQSWTEPSTVVPPQKAKKEITARSGGRDVYGIAASQSAAAPASSPSPEITGTIAPESSSTLVFYSRFESAGGGKADKSRNLPTEADSLYRRRVEPYYDESDFKKYEDRDTARYPKYKENEFESVLENPLSTFSIDVDTASYANVRRFLNEGRMPPKDAVRIEEMINYFSYSYPQPKGDEPFSVNMEVASCPWQPEHRLLRVGLKGKEMAQNKRPASNFVFLMDVSGSMSPQERLPLIKQSLRMLVKQMTENDRIAIVVYASSSGVVLESTSAVNKEKILEALDRLEAGGSTNGGQGIQRAYKLAEEHFIKGGVNRVILCTDGDFNVGITDQNELINLIQKKAKSGVFLSVLGVGTDNYKDALMQKLADKGNGNYHYLDSVEEAHKVLIKQMNGTLVTIAKDVKIQIEFNPAQVSSYRLVGYEKRILAAEDFNNDKKDAGEIGAGHTVTALYEIVPVGAEPIQTVTAVDDLKYQRKVAATPKPAREAISGSKEMLTLKLRYKKPDGDKSVLREHTLVDQEKKLSQASTDFRFAASVASFGMLLKDSEHKGRANFGSVLELAREAKGDDKEGYRAEFINLVKKAKELHHD